MTNTSDLFDLFVSPGVTCDEIAQMDLDTMEQHIAELLQLEIQQDGKVRFDLSPREIAVLIRRYARSQAIEQVVRKFLSKRATYKQLRDAVSKGIAGGETFWRTPHP